ncbi:hypothetical protein [Butyricimonas sp.]|uniref:hypothetical protein n=1 Tax=Butyricimonas sp. TaxID=1969738 RepID=UPI0025B9AD5E|nr:hypothetical protein [Butyricimonas sp.]
MKMKYIFLGLVWLSVMGCYDEDDIVVDDKQELTYALGVGHDYDEILHEWHNKYGFYPLYVFTDRDIYWNNTIWDNPNLDVWKGKCLGRPGDPDYVGKQVDLLGKVFMEIYPDELLKHFPLKMLLCRDLYETKYAVTYDPVAGAWLPGYDSTAIWTYRGYDFIAVNGASKQMEEMTMDDKCDLQTSLNATFLEYLGVKGVLTAPEEFFEVSDYWYEYLRGDDLFEQGYIMDVLVDGDEEESQKADFASYIKLAAYNMATLKNSPDKSLDGDSRPSWVGALNPEERDVNGLCGRKYEIVIRYLKSLGIDTGKLQYPVLD